MALVEPFKGYYFNTEKVSLDDVIVPPYDIISHKEIAEYKKRSPYSLINITLAEGKGEEKYKNARKFFEDLIKKDVLIQDKEPYFYVVEQIDSENEKKRVFFLGAVDLKQYKKKILPHEKTFEEPKVDRKKLLKTLKANIGIPLVLYSDLHREISGRFEYIMKGQPFLKFTDATDVTYNIWRLSDKKVIKDIQKIMDTKIKCISIQFL